MNNLAFIQKLVEAYKADITMYAKDGLVHIMFDKRLYSGVTFDNCIADIKQYLAIRYLEEIERK